MSDNEDATTTLGHSEVLSVEQTPRRSSPRPSDHTCARPSAEGNSDIGSHEGAQDLCEVQTVVGGQSSRHVLPDGPLDVKLIPDPHVVPEEPRLFAVKAGAQPGVTEVLAGRSADEDIGTLEVVRVKGRQVRVDRDARPVAGEDAASPRVYFAEPGVLVSGPREPQIEAAYAAAYGSDTRHATVVMVALMARILPP